jgi:lysophospholipase L1-like esterase
VAALSNSWKTRLGNLALVIVSLAIALLLAEFIVRTFYPQRLYFNVSQWDPYVGFTMIPGIEGYSKTDEFEMHIKINSRGLRDREIAYRKPDNTYRIGIFGDSFTFGEGVQNDEAFPKVLERLFAGDGEHVGRAPNIEVINFGIGKTATSHQLAFYRKEGQKYDLDMVIVAFLSGNDFGGNWGSVFYLEDDELVHNPTAYSSIRKIQKFVYSIPFYRWLAQNSHVVNLARKYATIYDDRRRTRQGAKKVTPDQQSDIQERQVYLTFRLFEQFRDEAEADGSRFLVVNLPAKGQKPPAGYARETAPPYVYQCAKLLPQLESAGIRVLNLVQVFADLPAEKYYFLQDGHMNAEGNERLAEEIYKDIRAELPVHETAAVPHRRAAGA